MSLEMADKVIVPQENIISLSFLNSGTLIVKLRVFPVFQGHLLSEVGGRLLCSALRYSATNATRKIEAALPD